MNDDTNPPTPDAENSGAATATAEAADGAALPAELVAQKERYQQLAADFANFRKRTTRDAEQRASEQKTAFIRELLPIVDNLERALASEAATSAGQIRRGVEMIWQQLMDLLRRHGIEPEESFGARFDAHRHEAINARLDPAHPDQTVIEVVERGYRRGHDVVRPAKVVINDLSLDGEEGEDHGG